MFWRIKYRSELIFVPIACLKLIMLVTKRKIEYVLLKNYITCREIVNTIIRLKKKNWNIIYSLWCPIKEILEKPIPPPSENVEFCHPVQCQNLFYFDWEYRILSYFVMKYSTSLCGCWKNIIDKVGYYERWIRRHL